MGLLQDIRAGKYAKDYVKEHVRCTECNGVGCYGDDCCKKCKGSGEELAMVHSISYTDRIQEVINDTLNVDDKFVVSCECGRIDDADFELKEAITEYVGSSIELVLDEVDNILDEDCNSHNDTRELRDALEDILK